MLHGLNDVYQHIKCNAVYDNDTLSIIIVRKPLRYYSTFSLTGAVLGNGKFYFYGKNVLDWSKKLGRGKFSRAKYFGESKIFGIGREKTGWERKIHFLGKSNIFSD